MNIEVNVDKKWTSSYRVTEFKDVRHFLFAAVPSAPPVNVRCTTRMKKKLVVSRNEPDKGRWSGTATRYKICYSTQQRHSRLSCKETHGLSSYDITSLQPATRYFVTVSAGTRDGIGPQSAEISVITNGGMNLG